LHFDNLPKEILEYFLSFLTANDLISLESVNKLFFTAISTKWDIWVATRFPRHLECITSFSSPKFSWKKALKRMEDAYLLTLNIILSCPVCDATLEQILNHYNSHIFCNFTVIYNH
jgi:hypothetical protein